jgi:surface protein
MKPSLCKHKPVTPKPSTGYCFTNADLKSAVDNYSSEEFSTKITCATHMTYGKIGTWCTSEVTDMGHLFKHKGTFDPEDPFRRSRGTFNNDISRWDVSSVTNMQAMFSEQSSFNQNLNNWNVRSVINMEQMFYLASSFNQPLDYWNVSLVTNMRQMFYFATSFDQSLSRWDGRSVINMGGMFNQNLTNWNVSSVTEMEGMFSFAKKIKQPLNGCNVNLVISMAQMFVETSYNQNLNNWDVSSLTSMAQMFSGATSFTQKLNDWDVSSVTNMEQMFASASSFNQPMQNMFSDASSFNQMKPAGMCVWSKACMACSGMRPASTNPWMDGIFNLYRIWLSCSILQPASIKTFANGVFFRLFHGGWRLLIFLPARDAQSQQILFRTLLIQMEALSVHLTAVSLSLDPKLHQTC